MAKDPAFLFYSNDFDSATKFFNHEQVGKYIRLLITQHQHGHLTKEQMIFICGTYDKDVFTKFDTDQDGKFFNKRLEDEVLRRKAFSESRSKNRSHKKDLLIISKTYDPHMETETETETITVNKTDNTTYKIEKCAEIAFADSRWVKANKLQDGELLRFNDYLEKQGTYQMNPLDYKRYFAKLKGKYPDLLIKKLSVEELRKIAEEMSK